MAARQQLKEEMGDLPYSTVRKYTNFSSELTGLPTKRGKPLYTLGEIAENDVQTYIQSLTTEGTPISARLVQELQKALLWQRIGYCL